MTAVSATITSVPSSTPYMPSCLPKPPKRIINYTIKTLHAPYNALRGVAVDCVEPEEVVPRTKPRTYSVGSTNRWRSCRSLGGDLLGSSQAIKAVAASKNGTVRRAKTAESAVMSVSRGGSFPESAWGQSPLPSVAFTSSPRDRRDYARKCSSLPPAPRRETPSHDDASLLSRSRYASSARTSRTRFKEPTKVLQMFARLANQGHEPDVRLHCLDHVWQLHKAYLSKSDVLSKLLQHATVESENRVYNNEIDEKVDSYICQSNIYTSEYKNVSRRLTTRDLEDMRKKSRPNKGVSHPVVDLLLDLSDPWLTRHSLAITLGHLYLGESIVATGDVVEVLATACYLKFHTLMDACCRVMIANLTADTVCLYLQAATRYEQVAVASACERWMELNLVSELSSTIFLKDVPADTLNKVLKSSRLFTFNEYALYKTLCYWLFMQLHPELQFMPSQTTVMTFFSSMTKTCSFLEREEGIPFSGAFGCLRLHGITGTKHLQDLMYMNVIPQSWLLRVLSHHYHALQGGGDMSFMLNFSLGASRFGFILEKEPGYHAETISLHGFHFEAKAQRQGSAETYIIYLQRLRPVDPALSFRACERGTFSMRRERLVRYQLTAQHPGNTDATRCHNESTGVLEQLFGLDQKSARSQGCSANFLHGGDLGAWILELYRCRSSKRPGTFPHHPLAEEPKRRSVRQTEFRLNCEVRPDCNMGAVSQTKRSPQTASMLPRPREAGDVPFGQQKAAAQAQQLSSL